jgi:hypothetical protein
MIRNTTTILLFALLLCTSAFSQSANVRGFYLKGVDDWLGDATQENAFLSYAQNNGFNYITLYDLGAVSFSSSTVKSKLASFISRAKTQYGITQVGAAGENYLFFANDIVPYNSGRPTDERFDVANFEFEFWVNSSVANLYCNKYLSPNGYACDTAGAFAFAYKEFKKIDSLCAARGLVSEVYFGWPNRGQIQKIASRADRILLHAYRPDDSDVYQYSRNRLIDIASISSSVKVITIFSSESSFMGPWLTSSSTHTVSRPYQTYSSYLSSETSSFKQYINLQGYTWFHYKYLPHNTVAALATVTANGSLSFCSGGSVILTANSGYQYLWSPGGQTSRSITVTSSGSYTVRVTNSAGVNATSSAVVINASSGSTPTITASGSTSFCPGGTVTLTSSSADTYLWSTGATTRSITVSSSGNYTVTTTTGLCTGTSAAINVNASSAPSTPTITSSGSLNICPNTPITLTSSSANGYLWSNGATTRSIVVAAAGTYYVKAYSSANCYAQSSNKVVSLLTLPATPTISLNGSSVLTSSHTSVTLTSSSASAYSWSNGSGSRSTTVSSQGSYMVTVTGSNGCKATSAAVSITANGCTPPPVPTITTSGSTIITSGESVTLTSSSAGGYLWSTGATTRSITVSSPGTYTVRNYNGGYCYSTSYPLSVVMISTRISEEVNAQSAFSMTAYPNPAREDLSFAFNSNTSKTFIFKLIDLTGREISSREIDGLTGENKFEMNVSSLPRGIYIGMLFGEGIKESVKIVLE